MVLDHTQLVVEPSFLDRLDVAWAPGVVEPRLERTVETKESEPTLAGNGLDPIVLVADGRLRPEVEVNRSVVFVAEIVSLIVAARKALAGLELRPRLGVVGDDRPEVLDLAPRSATARSVRVTVG